MTVRVWVNGELVGDRGSISALDHGVTVGDGVFETCKVENNEVFARERHHDRLDNSLKGLGLPPADRDRLDEGIAAVLSEPLEFGRVRYSVTAGPGPLGSDRDDTEATYIVLAGSVPRPPRTTAITTVPWTRNENSAVVGLKTTSYAENVVALAYAKERGGSEAIFANTRGELCEGTGSNIFVVVDGDVLTPPTDSGLLPGITRDLAILAAREEGITVKEVALPLSILQTADEVFITSSTRDVQAVSRVDERNMDAPGPVTARVADAFRARAATLA